MNEKPCSRSIWNVWFLANVNSLAICHRPSICLSSVCNVRAPYSGDWNFRHHLVRWPSADIQVKFYGDGPRGTLPSGELNTRGMPRVGPGHPSPPLSIYFIFSPFYFFLSFIGFTYFLLLSIPSLSTRIVPLRFQAGGRQRRPNLGLVSFFCFFCV